MANQKLKLLFLFQILLDNTDEKHGLSSEEIMTLLQEKGIHVERKTLYKDIEALKEYDVDIIKENAGKYFSRTFWVSALSDSQVHKHAVRA